jgi:hypothetical protein
MHVIFTLSALAFSRRFRPTYQLYPREMLIFQIPE